jgi:uncharacterized membrane protein YphA (DoxX/SURF4 family)
LVGDLFPLALITILVKGFCLAFNFKTRFVAVSLTATTLLFAIYEAGLEERN